MKAGKLTRLKIKATLVYSWPELDQ